MARLAFQRLICLVAMKAGETFARHRDVVKEGQRPDQTLDEDEGTDVAIAKEKVSSQRYFFSSFSSDLYDFSFMAPK